MTALEQAQALQQQAIEILLTERDAIDARLRQLGHGQEKAALGKKRGRPAKLTESALLSQTGNSESVQM